MTLISLKTRFTDLLHYMRDLQLTFADHLTDEERAVVGTEQHWSAKDTLFHNTVWANFHLTRLQAFERDGVWPKREDGGDFDKSNHEIFEKHQHKTWDEARAMIRDAYAHADAYLEHTSDDELLVQIEYEEQQRAKWRVIAADHVMHPMIHLWEYLLSHDHDDVLAELFGESFSDRLLEVSEDPGWRGPVLYNLACIHALSGQTQQAIEKLREGLRLAPNLIEWSKQDSDLNSLRDEPAYQALYN
jgi:hypothetical protein